MAVKKKDDWEDLGNYRQDKYIHRASYLIERGYVEGDDLESLAEKIYLKDNNSETDSAQEKQ